MKLFKLKFIFYITFITFCCGEISATVNKNSSLIELNKEIFLEEVVNTQLPVVLDFYADWCVPCKAMQRVLQELNRQYQGRIKFVKINVDLEKEIAEKFRVNELPVLLFIKEGKIAGIHTDFSEKEVVDLKIKKFLL